MVKVRKIAAVFATAVALGMIGRAGQMPETGHLDAPKEPVQTFVTLHPTGKPIERFDPPIDGGTSSGSAGSGFSFAVSVKTGL